MTRCFLKLSMVSIFTKAGDQVKNTILKGALFHQMLLQGK